MQHVDVNSFTPSMRPNSSTKPLHQPTSSRWGAPLRRKEAISPRRSPTAPGDDCNSTSGERDDDVQGTNDCYQVWRRRAPDGRDRSAATDILDFVLLWVYIGTLLIVAVTALVNEPPDDDRAVTACRDDMGISGNERLHRARKTTKACSHLAGQRNNGRNRRWATEGKKVGRGRRAGRSLDGEYYALRLIRRTDWESYWKPWTSMADAARGETESWNDAIDDPQVHLHEVGCKCKMTFAATNSTRATNDSECERGEVGKRALTHRPSGRPARVNINKVSIKAIAAILMAALIGVRVGEALNPGHGMRDPGLVKLHRKQGGATEEACTRARTRRASMEPGRQG